MTKDCDDDGKVGDHDGKDGDDDGNDDDLLLGESGKKWK